MVNDDAGTAFMAGCQACADGRLRSSNPNQPNGAIWSGWQRGWMNEYRRLPDLLRAARLRREPGLEDPDDLGPPVE